MPMQRQVVVLFKDEFSQGRRHVNLVKLSRFKTFALPSFSSLDVCFRKEAILVFSERNAFFFHALHFSQAFFS